MEEKVASAASDQRSPRHRCTPLNPSSGGAPVPRGRGTDAPVMSGAVDSTHCVLLLRILDRYSPKRVGDVIGMLKNDPEVRNRQ